MLAGLGTVALLLCQVFAGSRLSIQLSVRDELQRDPDKRAGEVRVLLSHANINTGVRSVEGANQETSIGVNDTIIQLDLGGEKNMLNLLKHQKYMELGVVSMRCGGHGVSMWVGGLYISIHSPQR